MAACGSKARWSSATPRPGALARSSSFAYRSDDDREQRKQRHVADEHEPRGKWVERAHEQPVAIREPASREQACEHEQRERGPCPAAADENDADRQPDQ